MEPKALIGKRKKKRPKCANPLFERWLQEWMDEASEKGWKSQYCYSKALKALRSFPLPLATGKDCKILQNFGDKICKMIDNKLAKHVPEDNEDSNQVLLDDDDDDDYADLNPANIMVKPAKQKTAKKAAAQSRTAVNTSQDPSSTISLDSDDDTTGPQRKRRKSSGSKGTREYIPALRSGGYAILLALYRNMQHPDTRGFMTKAEIIRDAQPLADKSFSLPDPGCRYTSWSSMGTLIKKALVVKESSPAKYSLSDAGCELAARLEAADANGVPIAPNEPARVPPLPQNPPPLPTMNPRLPALHSLSDSEEDADPTAHRLIHSLSDSEGETTPYHAQKSMPISMDTPNDSFRYWYVTEDSRLVIKKDEAAVTFDEELSIGFLIKCNYQQLLHSGKRYKLDTTKRFGDDHVFAYLSDVDSVEIATPPTETSQAKKKPAQTKKAPKTKKNPVKSTTPNEGTLQSRLLGHVPVERSTTELNPYQTDTHPTTSLGDRLPNMYPSSGTSQTSSGKMNSQGSYGSVKLNFDMPKSSVASSIASSVNYQGLPPPNFTLYPGTFDIVLCVDNREVYGKSQCQSKTLLPDLIKNGVDCDLRELQIGDMLWIAREKVHLQPGQLEKPKGRELVIDYIIERKRMDDLVSSMTDGRFREQKFRLKRSGIANAIYLIEDHGSMQHFSISEDRIKQAIANTNVIDGFKIKRTSGVKETVAYLTVMTRYLQSFYRNKTLQACTPEMLRELDGTFHIEEAEKLLTTFQHFSQYSVKSKDLTVRELFGKQLVQLHGMSADKAKAITDRYPTPLSLFLAYDTCPTQKEKENLLANIKCGKSMRSLGTAQSKQICQLYCTSTALT